MGLETPGSLSSQRHGMTGSESTGRSGQRESLCSVLGESEFATQHV